MKLFAYHDAAGQISSLLAANAPDGITLMAAAEPGQFVSEVEFESLSELRGEELMVQLREMQRSSIVEPGRRSLRRR